MAVPTCTVGGQRGQDLVADPDLAGQRRQQGVGFRLAVRIAAEAQGPVVVGELDAQRACGVQVSNLVGAGQQVPGHVAQPGGGVDQVGGGVEGGDLCEDPADCRVSCRLLRSPAVAKGPAFWRASISASRGRPSASDSSGAPWPPSDPRRPRFAGRPRRWPAGPPRSSAHRSPRPSPGWRCWWRRRCWSSSLLSSDGSPA